MPCTLTEIAPLFAGGDIRGPSAFACVALFAMVAYFRWRTSRGERRFDRITVCATVLISGPVFGVLYFLADAHLVSRHEFIHPDDYWGDLVALAALGAAAGCIASAILWVGLARSAPNTDG